MNATRTMKWSAAAVVAFTLTAGMASASDFHNRWKLRTEDATDKLPAVTTESHANHARVAQRELGFYERIELRTEDATDKLPEVSTAPANIPQRDLAFGEQWKLRTEDATDKLPK